MYVKYCENKPKSEYIVAEYFEYFEVQSSSLSLSVSRHHVTVIESYSKYTSYVTHNSMRYQSIIQSVENIV